MLKRRRSLMSKLEEERFRRRYESRRSELAHYASMGATLYVQGEPYDIDTVADFLASHEDEDYMPDIVPDEADHNRIISVNYCPTKNK